VRQAALLATTLAGCLVPNPLYDPQADSAGGSGATSTSTGASTGASAPDDSSGGGQSAGGSTGVGETTAEPTSTSSTGGASAAGSTGAATTTGCDACSECETCEGGQCVPLGVEQVCVVGEDLPCDQRIYGYVSEGCAVMKASDSATCDGAGKCRWQCADAPGAVPFKCDELCRPDSGKCVNGEDVATISIDDVCVTGGPSSACTDQCIEVKEGEFATEPRQCNDNGKCLGSGLAESCGNYACQPNGEACEDKCNSDVQCAGGSECHEMTGECVAQP
jgi:hypothetical protein